MFGQLKAICVLLLVCLLVTPATLKETKQEKGEKGAKCKKPTGWEGEVYNEGCTQYTCTQAKGNKGIWVDRPDLDGCCFANGKGYPVGDVIGVSGSYCSEITLLCGKGQNDTMASPTPYSTFTCFDEILTEVQGNGEGIQEIIDVVASGGGGSIGGGSEEESGVIQTPNYPDFYPYSSYEEWNLEVAEGKQIKLTFEGFYIEPAYCEFDYEFDSGEGSDWEFKDMSRKRAQESKADCGKCIMDYVTISYGSVEEKYCGSDIPGPITSSGNTMTVVFVSDPAYQFTGFSATWEAV